jgi:CubicO group peptidase (beta-lactamase class C family)
MSFDRERVRAAAEQHVGDTLVPGLVVLVAFGDEVLVEPFGNLAVGGPPMHRDSLFRIASMTKPITAAATLAVIEEGLVGLEEPVDRLLPELADRRVLKRMDGRLEDAVPAERSITTRDLLTFTNGFGMVTEMFAPGASWPVVDASRERRLGTIGPPQPDLQPDPDTWIAGLGALPLLAEPGERWMYNTGASVLGVLLARATGLPFADVLRTRLFEPLGMRDTGFWTPEVDRLATAYRPTPDGPVVWDEPDGQWSRPPAFGDGAAGLVSTADDLLAFSRMLLAGGAGVVPSAGVQEMIRDQLTDEQKSFGGLGPTFFENKSWGYCQAVYDGGAFGWNGGLGTSWVADPAHDLTIIVLTQRLFESAELPASHRDIQSAVYASLGLGG